MKPIIEFTRSGDTDPELFACGKCGNIFTSKGYVHSEQKDHRAMAEACCHPGKCEDGGDGGLPTYWLRCGSCAERRRFEKADKVLAKDYSGPVEHNGYFFGKLEEFLESCEDNDEQPEYAYACDVRIGASFDPDRVAEDLIENTHEDFEPEHVDELVAFFEQWNAKQEQVWWESTATVVVLDWAEETP